MPYNVPEEEKSAFNQKVKSSLELLTGDVSRTLGQLKVLQPETLIEAYDKPVNQQEALTPQEGVSPIVSEYKKTVGEDIISVTPYQQAVTNAALAETDSLRNETGAIMDSPIEVFSKPLDKNKIKLLGLADDEMKPTEKGKLFYNLQEAGMFDGTGVITEKGAAYLTPINELGKPENLKAFQTLWDDKVIRHGASFGEITENTAKFIGDAMVGGAEGIAVGAESLWRRSQTWAGLFGKTDNRPQELRDKITANNLGFIEGAVENLSGWAGMADVGAAWIGKKLYDVLPAGMEEEAEQAMYAARQRQWQTQQDIANLDAGEIAESVLGIDNAVREAEDAKSRMGKDAFNEKYGQAGSFAQLVADPTNYIPISAAVNAAKMAPLANRLSITAQKRMVQIAAQDLAIAQGRTAIETANAVLKKEATTVGIANRLGADIASRAGANPELVARANQASQIANRITQSADQIRATLPSVSAELEGLVAKRNSLATRIPEAYAQKVLQTMEVGRQARSMPAKAIGATLERVGDTLSKTDDAVTNFLKDRGLDQMYTAAVGAAGIAGMAGSPIIGAVAAGAATLKAGKVLSSYGKLFRYVGKEMENVRGQIPFWKRVASHTAPNSLGRGIAHSFNMLDLGGVTSDVIRRTGRGIVAAAPSDLMFEYLSDGADMRPETLYQAASESLIIGGSFAAAGGAFMGTKKRMRELSIGDELNFKRDLVDPRQKALFEAIPSGTRSAIATYSIANPTLNYQFKDSGASQYDPNTNTATINVKSSNPIKALVAHETLHHTIIKNNMESGISALFLGDMKENTVGGLFRSRDGKLDPNFEAFKDAYYKRLGVTEMSNAERDAIYPLDKVAVEYFIEKHSDQYSEMADSGELGAIAASGAARRKLGSILETILPRVPVLRDLHFKSGGMIDKNGSWVTGNGILDAEGIKTDPITNKMFRDMNRRSAGLATGQFEPLISDKPDSGASIILNPSDSIDSELLHPLVKTDESGKPIFENGKPIALDKATELERSLAGLTVNEVLRRKRSENYAPEKGEAFIDDNDAFQAGWLPDDAVSEMFAKNRFNPEQKRIIREMNRLVKKGTGDRVVMINFPATTRNKSGKAVYKPQGATLRDTVPVAILTSKDGNLLFGLMSVTKLQENIQKRSQSARGKRLYSGNVDLILRDTQAMMDFHKNGVDSIEYFSEKYGAVEADQRKKFINTMFGLLNQKEQAVLNPMLLEDGVKSRDNVYRTYRADRVSKAVPMAPEDYPAMPFSYKATSQVLLPEQTRQMPEGQANAAENVKFSTPPSEAAAKNALSSSKQPFFGEHRKLKEGTSVGVRIDIPAFLSKGQYVQTVHKKGTTGNVGERIGYDTHVRLKDGVRFFVKEGSATEKGGAVAIKEGRANKHPIATVEGKISNDRSVPADINEWTPVGMDPKKHSYFYDKTTNQPVIGGSESYSVGNTVFVKDPIYAEKSQFRYMPEPTKQQISMPASVPSIARNQARFLPEPIEKLAAFAGKRVQVLTSDLSIVKDITHGEHTAKFKGGPGYLDNDGWAFTAKDAADAFVTRWKKDGKPLIGLASLGPANHLNSLDARKAYGEKWKSLVESNVLSEQEVSSHIQKAMNRIAESDAKSVKPAWKTVASKIKNANDLAEYFDKIPWASAPMFYNKLTAKTLPIPYKTLVKNGLDLESAAKEYRQPEFHKSELGDLYAIAEYDGSAPDYKPELNSAYPWRIKFSKRATLSEMHNVADLTTDPRAFAGKKVGGRLGAQPLMVTGINLDRLMAGDLKPSGKPLTMNPETARTKSHPAEEFGSGNPSEYQPYTEKPPEKPIKKSKSTTQVKTSPESISSVAKMK